MLNKTKVRLTSSDYILLQNTLQKYIKYQYYYNYFKNRMNNQPLQSVNSGTIRA